MRAMFRLISAKLTTPEDEYVCCLCIYGLVFFYIATVVYAVANIMFNRPQTTIIISSQGGIVGLQHVKQKRSSLVKND